jgi:hypothetical protein
MCICVYVSVHIHIHISKMITTIKVINLTATFYVVLIYFFFSYLLFNITPTLLGLGT